MRRRRISSVVVIAVAVFAMFLSEYGNISPQDTTSETASSSSSLNQSSTDDKTTTAVTDTSNATASTSTTTSTDSQKAIDALNELAVKGKAPKTGYERAQFGDGWSSISGCTTRNIILNRDMTNVVLDEDCKVLSGILNDPYTGEIINFTSQKSTAVQIDHVVALSNAWQTGAQQLSKEQRVQLANDPLELLAVDGPANQAKSDGDAATWLPSNKTFRCAYVARQIAVKKKYSLWVTSAEKTAMTTVLNKCPDELLPSP